MRTMSDSSCLCLFSAAGVLNETQVQQVFCSHYMKKGCDAS
uniref:Uncharacterized protein n=1 Tax=Faecalibaculum rodentium TaxID=1702221 RepID=A0A140DTV0_9FIRM|nr:hypothetical protein AALO17_09430 [Faecalibaculum rodentium]